MRTRFAAATTAPDRRLSFEDHSLDLASEQLLQEGEVASLTPEAFAVLRRLATRNILAMLRDAVEEKVPFTEDERDPDGLRSGLDRAKTATRRRRPR